MQQQPKKQLQVVSRGFGEFEARGKAGSGIALQRRQELEGGVEAPGTAVAATDFDTDEYADRQVFGSTVYLVLIFVPLRREMGFDPGVFVRFDLPAVVQPHMFLFWFAWPCFKTPY